MKHLTLLLAGALLFALPQSVHAAEQCTTNELDLVCNEGEFLRGISPDGTKICENASGLGGGGSLDCYQNFIRYHPVPTDLDTMSCNNGYTMVGFDTHGKNALRLSSGKAVGDVGAWQFCCRTHSGPAPAVTVSASTAKTVAELDRSNYINLGISGPRFLDKTVHPGGITIISGDSNVVSLEERRYETRGSLDRSWQAKLNVESTLSCTSGWTMTSCDGGSPKGNSCVDNAEASSWGDVRITCEKLQKTAF